MAEIRLNVNPRFSLDVDAATLGLLEKFATFWRGQHPSERNPDVDQIGDFLRSALCKLQDYDEVTRGIRMASTTASLEPEEKPGLCVEPPTEALPGPPQAMGPPPVPEAPLQEGVIDPSPPLIPEPEARPPIDFDPPSPGGPMPGPSFRDDPPPPPPAGPAPGAPPLPEEPEF